MAWHLENLGELEMIELAEYGKMNQSSILKWCCEALDTAEKSGVRNILLDVRAMDSELPYNELFNLPDNLSNRGFSRDNRVAIAVRKTSISRMDSEAFRKVVDAAGFQVSLFIDIDEARAWLDEKKIFAGSMMS